MFRRTRGCSSKMRHEHDGRVCFTSPPRKYALRGGNLFSFAFQAILRAIKLGRKLLASEPLGAPN